MSDLGDSDTSVATVKSVLMGYAEDAVIVDITHNVVRDDLQQAAYIMFSAFWHFPAGTVHVIAVDVFAGAAPCILLAERDGHFFIAPDNGFLPLAFGNDTPSAQLCFECQRPYNFNDWVTGAGRVIAAILAGNKSLYPPHTISVSPILLQPIIMADCIDCNIRYIDRFENVVLNIRKDQFDAAAANRPFRIRVILYEEVTVSQRHNNDGSSDTPKTVKVMRHEDITSISNNYNDVPAGGPLARFNGAGYLEIASNHGSGKALLGLEDEDNISKTIKIFLAPR